MRSLRRPLLLLLLPLAAVTAGCGSQGIEVAENDPDRAGAELFMLNCSGCHTIGAAGTEGSSSAGSHDKEYKDGPNFEQRKETYDQVLYAIRNGGYSSGPMPQNIVVGKEAEQVARFVEKYSGAEAGGQAQGSGNPGNAPAAGTGGG